MRYYQVKKECDNKPRLTIKNGKLVNDGNIYIGGELYTENEAERLRLNKNYMELKNYNKNDTYTFFGARMVNTL